ncbi:single-stranded DNA-binding protein [Micromonospora inyonensis]|uniref:Single-strand DNA-binding protein n=1 Tax=Micromonospora inyonensis TaxID=47866 RepID=A0A1C6RXN6_9ACTN|nr:single-stranded DNA-binding protein [Micromonospora inyonensis]SCL21790.1 single-strand DNA-binding protein [Micromonospora inyonensis]
MVGNVLTAPEWRRTAQSGTLVANFKVASTARRLDRESGRWVDGNSLRVRVNCWRKLAEGVASSVMVGDPVVVAGRLYTRDWIDDAGNQRTLYELEAVTVGHDLARGRGRFLRNRPSMATSTVEDADAERRVHGEPTEPVPGDEAPVPLDDRPLDDDLDLPASGDPRRLPGLPVSAVDLGPDPFDTPARGSTPIVRTVEPTGATAPVGDDELAALPEGDDLPEDPVVAGPIGELDPLPEAAGLPGGIPTPGETAATPGEAAMPARRGRRGGRGGTGGLRGDAAGPARQPVPA